MVRRDDDGGPAEQSSGSPASRCVDLAGASPVSVSASAPSSRPAAEGEIPTADFLGCHFHKRLSGAIHEREGKRVYFLHRWPSPRAMQRIRQKVRDKTQRGRCHADIREVIEDLNPILQGWGRYFATGNAAIHFTQVDRYVVDRLRSLHVKRAGRNIDSQIAKTWKREYFESLGLCRLRGTIRYPKATQYRWHESPPASRVREIRTHGFYGGRTETHNEGK